jgi:amidohydrolase
MDPLKQVMIDRIDQLKPELVAISHALHAEPELAFKEFKAAARLTAYLELNGFSVRMPVAGLETAFEATYGTGTPVIAVLAEYDALPDLGHACGHNIIAAAAVGAGMAAKATVDRYGGQIRVIGTPGEEGNGGKIDMVAAGVFDGIDAVLMVHPSRRNVGLPAILAAIALKVEYHGKEAHASAAPEEGVNALDAMILAFNGINALRQHIHDSSRIHGVITDGGRVPNVVPAYAAGTFIVRAAKNDYLETLKKKVVGCLEAGAAATGARLSYHWFEKYYAALKPNRPLVELFCENMALLGRPYVVSDPNERFGSTDLGNVSLVAPAMHPSIAIVEDNSEVHTPEFCRAAVAEGGDKGMLDAAKAMAMTVADLLADERHLQLVRDAFG